MDPKVLAAFKLAAGQAVPVLLKMAQRAKPYDDINHTDQQRAISMLMDRGWGRAVQAVDMDVTSAPAVILGEPMTADAWQKMATGASPGNGKAANGAANGSE